MNLTFIKKVFDKYIKEKNLDVTIIVVKDRKHLDDLIENEMKKYGNKCNLNHIDVSNITDLSNLFYCSKFNGNISEWNVSNVNNMTGMFQGSLFDGNISRWNVSHVRNMSYMFADSCFNNDISKWNVSNVTDMGKMFCYSQFNNDISNWNILNVKEISWIFFKSIFDKNLKNWKPYDVEDMSAAFYEAKCIIPYWANYEDKEERKKAIDNYLLNKELEKVLVYNDVLFQKRLKL